MAWYRVNVIQHYVSGLPEDVAVNTLYFVDGSPDPIVGTMNSIATQINTAWGFLDNFRGAQLLDTAGMSLKIYDQTAPPNSSPVGVYGPYNLGAPTAVDNLPLEVAAVCSFQGAIIAGTNRARRRGRNYIGPLNTTALAAGDSTTPPALSAGMITALRDYMSALWDTNSAANPSTWSVYSRADDAMVTITNGWVDNDFDTQRRRGKRATTRSNITFS